MLKVAFPSFKISKFSGREFLQNPVQVSVSGACLLGPPPPPPLNAKYVPPSLNIQENPKLFWSHIKRSNVDGNVGVPDLMVNGSLTSDPLSKANALN